MKDLDALKTINEISLNLLGYNKGTKHFKWGERLYGAHKHLEKRLPIIPSPAPVERAVVNGRDLGEILTDPETKIVVLTGDVTIGNDHRTSALERAGARAKPERKWWKPWR